MTAALRQMGLQMETHFSGFHQVLNRARWSPLAVSRRLLQVLVQTFVRAGGTVEIVIDETLERALQAARSASAGTGAIVCSRVRSAP